MSKEINRIRYIYEIFKILAEAKEFLSISNIHKKLEEHFEILINPRTVKEYVATIQNSFDLELKTKKGPEGGYLLSNEWRESISRLATLQLSKEERNALNDAFEIAFKSPTYFYSHQLEEAKRKLYTKTNLKDNDNEFYVGKNIRRKEFEQFVYDFKQAAIDKHYVHISFKHEYYGYPIEEEKYKPLYIIHDSDETFMIIKNQKDEVLHQNLLNIKTLSISNKKFVDSSIKKVEEYKNDFSINIKGKHPLKFKIKTARGKMIFDLWNYEFEDLNPNDGDEKNIIFYERYILLEFLFRMQKHIEILYIDPVDKEYWNQKVLELKVI